MATNTFKIYVKKSGVNPAKWIKQITASLNIQLSALGVTLADQTADRMKEVIRTSIKRLGSTGTLENSIINEFPIPTLDSVEVGIGMVDNLPPYWEVINAGGYVPQINLGYFAGGLGTSGEEGKPVSGGAGEEWVHTGSKGDFLLTPSKPIEPIRYIEISNEELEQHLTSEVQEIINKINQE